MEKIDKLKFKGEVAGAGLTVAAVCDEAGVSRATVSVWMNKKENNMGVRTYNKLVDAFNKLGGSDE